MLNSCILTGNLGADPEVFYSSEGSPVASFNLAFRSSKKKTGWIKITCFQRLAETAERYLHKGARIAVIGYLDQQKWETDEGVTRSSFQLIANTLEFIKTDGRGFEEGQGEDGTVCLQKVLDRSGIKIREGFRFQIPSFSLLSNL
jgi:single-strand DNA-binding protein